MAVGLFFRSAIAPMVNLLTVGVAYLVASGVLGWLGQARGLVVPLSTGVLIFAELSFFQAFGPALAVAVLVGALVTITFVPCVLALLGRFALWPLTPARDSGHNGVVRRGTAETRTVRARIARFAVQRLLTTIVTCVLLLATASVGLVRYDVANPVIQSLPASAGPQRAYDVAAAALTVDGVLVPTVAVVRAPGAALDASTLRQLKPLLAGVPGVARVYGPGDVPLGLGVRSEDYFIADGGDLARFFVVFESDPLDGPAVDALRALQDRAPALLRQVGLDRAELLLGGDTAITASLVDRTLRDLLRVAPVALLAIILMLALLAALGISATVAGLDAFLVRQFLVPALLVVAGIRDWRPGSCHGIN